VTKTVPALVTAITRYEADFRYGQYALYSLTLVLYDNLWPGGGHRIVVVNPLPCSDGRNGGRTTARLPTAQAARPGSCAAAHDPVLRASFNRC
jgi:hypothetical protein